MPELQQFPVATPDGAKGTIFRRARFLDRDERSIVRLEDGREFEVNSSEVQVRPDGTFLLNSAPPRSPEQDGDSAVDADYPLYAEDVGVERKPVNRLVDTAPETRQEGDVTIIPVVEEVLVVEKRLLVKEEIHIRRTRNQVLQPRRVVVDGPDHIRVLEGLGNEVRS